MSVTLYTISPGVAGPVAVDQQSPSTPAHAPDDPNAARINDFLSETRSMAATARVDQTQVGRTRGLTPPDEVELSWPKDVERRSIVNRTAPSVGNLAEPNGTAPSARDADLAGPPVLRPRPQGKRLMDVVRPVARPSKPRADVATPREPSTNVMHQSERRVARIRPGTTWSTGEFR
ncbi:hypothetical protein [Actibacterium sp. 188UL27-1]|uniref:hypothetical protein n=1 Tax=Actibacterium sp. 188UL27-1 TaxID=2786961 RepID=UPI001956D706|nr:hypothetical protein [Actibacterium sp. 188UL27-1]